MRLLSSSTLQLTDFPNDRQLPAYAILSHTWGEDEVLYVDMERGNAKGKAGYEKIRNCCRVAFSQGFDYIWVDTCCIDKRSSAELSEAINSMYTWYKGSSVCYAFLADVAANGNAEIPNSAFADSKWFKRGWTLQELIAPGDLVFYSHEWIEFGTKSTLNSLLTEITGIDVAILNGSADFQSTSVAKRMSWASNRATTRIEDIAYCLMGLFDVNMPLLYGEGEKAFTRLQEEIIKHSDDHSLFAWTDPAAPANCHRGLLAKSPADFINSGSIMPYHEWEPSAPFSISNKGLRIELRLTPLGEGLYVAALDCPSPPTYEGFLGIYLKRVSTGNHQYVRVKPQALCKVDVRGNLETLYVRNFALNHGPQDIYPQHTFQLRSGPSQEDGYKLIKALASSNKSVPAPVLTSQKWPPNKDTYNFKITKGNRRLAGALLLERVDGERLVILLGSTTDFAVGFQVLALSNIDSPEELQRAFNPQVPGTNLALENHQVRVNADPRVYAGVKCYMVDIVVEGLYHERNPIEMIKEILPVLQGQPNGRPPNAGETPSRSMGKLKLPWGRPKLPRVA